MLSTVGNVKSTTYAHRSRVYVTGMDTCRAHSGHSAITFLTDRNKVKVSDSDNSSSNDESNGNFTILELKSCSIQFVVRPCRRSSTSIKLGPYSGGASRVGYIFTNQRGGTTGLAHVSHSAVIRDVLEGEYSLTVGGISRGSATISCENQFEGCMPANRNFPERCDTYGRITNNSHSVDWGVAHVIAGNGPQYCPLGFYDEGGLCRSCAPWE